MTIQSLSVFCQSRRDPFLGDEGGLRGTPTGSAVTVDPVLWTGADGVVPRLPPNVDGIARAGRHVVAAGTL